MEIPDVVSSLRGWISGGAGKGPFGVERFQSAGTPALWEEQISVTHGGLQLFRSTRNSVDEGGIPIGEWSAPVEPEILRGLAEAMLVAQPWTLGAASIAPGQEAIEWRFVTPGGSFQRVVEGGSSALFTLAPLDSQMRSVAYALKEAHHGAELRCSVSVKKGAGGYLAQVHFHNDGDKDGVFANPLKRSKTPDEFCRIDVGRMPVEQPGVTSLGISYEPLVELQHLPIPGDAGWQDDFLVLPAKSAKTFPTPLPLNVPPVPGVCVRAVYSNYGADRVWAGMPVLRGRVFSKDEEVTP
jgi:hypothetical protein